MNNKKLIWIIVAAIIIATIILLNIFKNSIDNPTDPVPMPPSKPGFINDFCGESSLASCTTDVECAPAGCSSQICARVGEDLITTCEWRECYDASKYNIGCGCINNKCQWH